MRVKMGGGVGGPKWPNKNNDDINEQALRVQKWYFKMFNKLICQEKVLINDFGHGIDLKQSPPGTVDIYDI